MLIIFLWKSCFHKLYICMFAWSAVYVYLMQYTVVLYCIVLYCIVLHCMVLHCIVLHGIILYCIALYCIVLYCIVYMISTWSFETASLSVGVHCSVSILCLIHGKKAFWKALVVLHMRFTKLSNLQNFDFEVRWMESDKCRYFGHCWYWFNLREYIK